IDMSSKKNDLKIDERVLQYKAQLYEQALEHLKVTIPQRIIDYQKLAHILQSHNTLKKHYVDLIETFSVIRCWISLNVPRIEDGNNFGVDIQEEMIGTLTKLEDIYTTLLEQSENYFIHRANTIKKALKHRDIDDFKQAIIQQDEKELIRFRFSYHDLANNYATTYSTIIKNFQKLEAPRPTSSAINM
ncbi:hypothetical protein SAMD00019534_089750, partial [Acytostelium subglobosum LB1]|uniref:hypothetical protein n=1 Tax=Acytostelium subglobosum LB1 TaxID=1410327 RepID=UPI000644D292